jgi:hypothetical protein
MHLSLRISRWRWFYFTNPVSNYYGEATRKTFVLWSLFRSDSKNPQLFLISPVHFALLEPNRRCLEGGRIHDSNGRNFSLSKWTLKHSYFPRLLLFCVRTNSHRCKQNRNCEGCKKKRGKRTSRKLLFNQFRIWNWLVFYREDDRVMKIMALSLLLRRLFFSQFQPAAVGFKSDVSNVVLIYSSKCYLHKITLCIVIRINVSCGNSDIRR